MIDDRCQTLFERRASSLPKMKVDYRKAAPNAVIALSIGYFIYSRYSGGEMNKFSNIHSPFRLSKPKRKIEENEDENGPLKVSKSDVKVGVDGRFYKQLRYILRVCVPSWKSRPAGILALHTLFLVARTYLTVVVARIDGRLVKELVSY